MLAAVAASAAAASPATTAPSSAAAAATVTSSVPPALFRRVVADVATAQVKAFDPAWEPAQRDCAGLVRFAYRQAFKTLNPQRLDRPLFVDDTGAGVDFADAATLVRGGSFRLMGRGDDVRSRLQSGDLLVFRQERDDGEMWHVMMAVVPSSGPARVVYHPGPPEPGRPPAAVRHGLLRELADEAPLAWRPVVDNPAFLGFFRFTEITE